MTPEGVVLKACLSFLAVNGIFCFRNNTGGTPLHDGSGKWRPGPKSSIGSADIIGVARWTWHDNQGREYRWPLPLAVEVKSKRGKQSPAQREFQQKWEAAGGLYVLCRSVDELRDALRDAGVSLRAT